VAKTSLKVNKEQLQKIVTELESKTTFRNHTELWKAVCETEWAKNLKPKPLTPSVAYLRAKEFKIAIITKPGRIRHSQDDSILNYKHDADLAVLDIPEGKSLDKAAFSKFLIRSVPQTHYRRYKKLVEKVSKGFKAPAIKLKCITCSDFNVGEVKHCQVFECPLYMVRPFQKGKVE
jgi:hypothetical protein